MNDTDRSDVDVGHLAARILEVKRQRDARMTHEMLREIARELGLSDADLKAVARVAAHHLARGRSHRRVDDAIAEFDLACTLDPRNIDAVFALASAVGARFTAKRHAADKEWASRLARDCLDLDPEHAPSFALLNALETKPRSRAPLTAAVAVVVIVGGVAGVALVKRDPTPTVPAKENSTTAAIPVTLVNDANSQGLRLETRVAELRRYPDRAFFELRALLHNERPSEVREIDVRIELLDVSGAVVAADTKEALSDTDGALRTGDAAPLSHFVTTAAPTTAAARLTIVRVVDELLSSWPAAPEVPLHWPDGVLPPAGVSVAVTERSRAVDVYDDSAFLKATWAFENRGTRPLSMLKVELRMFNKAGDVVPTVGNSESFVTLSADAEVRAGETRLMRVIENVDPATDHVELWVVKAKS